ncbi:hypothetical protein PRIPAC_95810 [Pristionchus pacificus]|uniref:ADP ribosylation factor n=1 Tax=Pristionchus pacificus TaxID=54126 RepID=A0A2A6BJS4_PRIPA|nr:hypothetical protein PRIPAC_95810 [Pristionchus pacificus]|eukprot:PDM66137.1 ADP ribosylation factor [Pristionchus pacificus]
MQYMRKKYTYINIKYRQMYVRRTDSILFVIDSANSERMKECKEELDHLFREEIVPSRIPFLIILNKIDLPGAMREEEILERIGIYRHKHDFTIVNCCAITGVGLDDFVERLNASINESRLDDVRRATFQEAKEVRRT